MESKKIERGIILYVWVYALIVSLILFIIEKKYPVLFLLGVAANLFCFTVTIKTIDRAIKVNGKKSKTMLFFNGLLKIILYGIVLAYVAYKAKQDGRSILVDVILTAVGMMSVKIMIIFKHLVIDKVKEKRMQKLPKETGHE